jgi:hypothetical protein
MRGGKTTAPKIVSIIYDYDFTFGAGSSKSLLGK